MISSFILLFMKGAWFSRKIPFLKGARVQNVALAVSFNPLTPGVH